jgi:hypothetical protein
LRYDLVASDISGYVSENELRSVLGKVRSSEGGGGGVSG